MATWYPRGRVTDFLLLLGSLGVLAIGVFYTAASVLSAPRPGFTLNSSWIVVSIDRCPLPPEPCPSSNLLQVGDKVTRIGKLTYAQYRQDFLAMPFGGDRPGDLVALSVVRAGQSFDVAWNMPPLSPSQRWLSATPLLAFLPFWLAGTLALLFLRPRGRVWALLIGSNYLFAIWAITGIDIGFQIAGSPYPYVLASWLVLPVYIRFHQALLAMESPRTRRLTQALFVFALVMAGLTLAHLVPFGLCPYAVIVAILASLGQLIYGLRMAPPRIRPTARLMLLVLCLAFGPPLAMYLWDISIDSRLSLTLVTTLSLLAVVIWPVGYVYAAFRNSLGALELRANRLIISYSYVILVATLVGLAAFTQAEPNASPLTVLATVILITLGIGLMIRLYQPFERWIERQAYGVLYTPEDILKVVARQLPVVSDQAELIHFLADELLPSLLIRESALYQLAGETPLLIYQRGDQAELTPSGWEQQTERLWIYQPPSETADWVRLSGPLEVQHHQVGLWLFGRRDPDDFYSAQDIVLLRLLANQVAVALENTRLYQTVQQQAVKMAQLYEAEKEVSRLKSEFLARTSHELRTPLAGILGSLDLIRGDDGLPADEQRKFVDAAHRSAKTLLHIVNDLIDMAQIEAGRLTPNLWAVDPALLVSEVQAEFEARARLKNVRLEVVPAAAPVGLVWADIDRARQILRNLVDNALKFTEAGWVQLAVLADADPAAQALHIRVTDTGIGIAPDQQAALFQPFVQVDGGDQRRYGGSGLGLAISRRLAELMGGTLTLISPGENQGTVVTLTLRPVRDLEPLA